MKKKLFKYILNALLMILFATISYIFFYTGINTKTKVYVNYQEKSSTNYEVKLLNNDLYDNEYDKNNWHYITKLVDDIKVNYEYKNTLSEYTSGYYKYNVSLELLLYKDSEDNIITKKNYILKEDTVKVIDDIHVNLIKVEDSFNIDFNKYYDIYKSLKDKYDVNANGKINIKVSFYNYLGFDIIEGDTAIENAILLSIPLDKELIKINDTNIDSLGTITNFTTKSDINYISILIGIIFLALSLTFLVIIIKYMISLYKKDINYKTILESILKEFDKDIVNVREIIQIKDYNIIYVDTFKELLDVSKKYKTIINFKETVHNRQSVFIVIAKDNAWIYTLENY